MRLFGVHPAPSFTNGGHCNVFVTSGGTPPPPLLKGIWGVKCPYTSLISLFVTVARPFIDDIFALHGMPERIVNDKDTRFTCTFRSFMCELWKVDKQLSTAYHPRFDGQTMRFNRTLEDTLRHWCSPVQDDWNDYLKLTEFACNNATHASPGETPSMLTFGQHPYTPASLFRLGAHGKLRNPAADEFAAGMSDIVQTAKESLLAAQARQKCFADHRRRAVT